ncbi:Gfo/Idh/MocA family protein [Marinoscillum sp. MHG1-6]|uniref:Gfo/Idh/MocA family protein n=1 Tax=Marinoscillum sp. MHG1-6 TaxID=2959627 RepID=UPI0021570EE3|nr:Gfo/Idh/MocA family oxidoreductase [Marinoscillum sp. MHG1-6]
MIKYGIRFPQTTLPIYIIGAGGIVNDAHLPAYKLAGFEVAGIVDIDRNKAKALAEKFSIPKVFNDISALVKATSGRQVIYDVAVPGSAVLNVIHQLPDNSHVLIQKPMGENLHEAQEILRYCRLKNLNAAINFQMRYAPYVNEARRMIESGEIGELCDIAVNVNVFTPWHLWDFLFKIPRVEILYHSIHYVDLIRSFLGNPGRIYSKTVKHPAMKELASVRTSMIMDYGDMIRANIITNHAHNYGLHNQHSYIKFEGTNGAIKINFGVLMNYPKGEPDRFEYVVVKEGEEPQWQTREIDGTWFPHAFIGSMAQVMLAATGEINRPDNTVEDCIYTMACVEAAYHSSETGGVSLPKV